MKISKITTQATAKMMSPSFGQSAFFLLAGVSQARNGIGISFDRVGKLAAQIAWRNEASSI